MPVAWLYMTCCSVVTAATACAKAAADNAPGDSAVNVDRESASLSVPGEKSVIRSTLFVALGAAGPHARAQRVYAAIEARALAMDAYVFESDAAHA